MNIQENILVIKEIKSIFEKQGKNVGDTLFDIFKCFNMKKLCSSLGYQKQSGYKLSSILTVLLLFPIMMIKTVRGFILSSFHLTQAQKDVFYRTLNNEHLNWRKLLYATAKKFRSQIPKNEAPSKPVCGVIDDTVLGKTGRKIENIGKVFDHILKLPVLGFKCQLYSFFDGKSIFPLDFSLHAETGRNAKRPYGLTIKQLKQRFQKERSPRSNGFKRNKELFQDKITTALEVIKRAAKNGFVPEYLLADNWYGTEKFIATIRKIKRGAIHFLGMIRRDKRLYIYDGDTYSANELLRLLKPRKKRCRKLNSCYVEVIVEHKGVGIVKLFFSRFSHRGHWQLLLTTDCKLSYIKAMEIYSLRWGIEVLFKECKQLLNLGKCQSNDFDAQIAETTLSFMFYTMLSFYKRVHSYETIGSLFAELKDRMLESSLADRLWQFMLSIFRKLEEVFGVEPLEQFKRILVDDKFVEDCWMFFCTLFGCNLKENLDNAP